MSQGKNQYTCIVEGCTASESKIFFHEVPQNVDIRNKWLDALERNDLIMDSTTSTMFVCDMHHFRIRSFYPNSEQQNLFNSSSSSNVHDLCSASSSKTSPLNCDDNIRYYRDYIKRTRKEYTVSLVKRWKKWKQLKKNLIQMQNTRHKHKVPFTKLKSVPGFHTLSPALRAFILQKLDARKKKSYQLTLQEKSLFLCIYRHSPKCYNYLRQILLYLPSIDTLRPVPQHLKLQPGINKQLFECLHAISKTKRPKDRYCTLLWHEMMLSASLLSGSKQGGVDGFAELSTGREPQIADRALVFMIRGLCTRWKQPVAFYFAHKATGSNTLKACILQVVQAIHKQTGFTVLATVSDLRANNRAAVESLISADSLKKYCIYEVDGHEIVHLFDAPHLLKSLRNNFMASDIRFNGNTAKWEDLRSVYELLALDPNGKFSKLTADHMDPVGKKKRNVRLAAQIFSGIVSAILSLQDNVEYAINKKPKRFVGSAEFVLFVNKLFDSLNSGRKSPKKIEGRVTRDSCHRSFWYKARANLRELQFVSRCRPPCVDGFLVTVRNVQALWNSLNAIGFEYLSTRCLNLDPLENLFDVIRGLGGHSSRPTCSQFISGYAIAIVNDAVKSGREMNCEEDSDKLLLNLKSLRPTRIATESQCTILSYPIIEKELSEMVRHANSSYFAGCILRHTLNIECQTCKDYLLSSFCPDTHASIRLRDSPILYYPSHHFIRSVHRLRAKIFHFIPDIITSPDILQCIFNNTDLRISVPCFTHSESINSVAKFILGKIILHHFLKTVNSKLKLQKLRPHPIIDNFLLHSYPSLRTKIVDHNKK